MALCSEVLKAPRVETTHLSQRHFLKLNSPPSEDFFPNLHPERPKLLPVAAALPTTTTTKKVDSPILVTSLQLAAGCIQKVK